jgi:lysozyme family protein
MNNNLKYMLVAKMQARLEYYLNFGQRSKNVINEIDEFIKEFEELYNSLPQEPLWLSRTLLEKYKKQLAKKDNKFYKYKNLLNSDKFIVK